MKIDFLSQKKALAQRIFLVLAGVMVMGGLLESQDRVPRQLAISWEFLVLGDENGGPPLSAIWLRVQEGSKAVQRHFLTTAFGSTGDRDTPLSGDAGVLSALSWFAGGGEEFQVQKTSAGLEVQRRGVDEGTMAEGPYIGEWETFKTIKIPTGFQVQTAPATYREQPDPLRTLYLAKKPLQGPDVELLQLILGIEDIDGWFGPETKNRVIEYQKAQGLEADGVVGPITWGALLEGKFVGRY